MRNIVFDMGNVLITYDPEHFLDRAGILDMEDRRLLLKHIFHSPDWPQMDWGNLSEEEMAARALPRLPEQLREIGRRMIFDWNHPVEPIPGMAALIRALKARGLGIYLLSNASRRQPEYWPEIPGSECFDGCVISALEGCVKPRPRIYRILLERFGLRAEDCLFVDDMRENVEGARAVGIPAVRFDGDAQALEARILAWLEEAHN